VGKSEELYDLKKIQWKKSKDLHTICYVKLLKNPMKKIEEIYPHKNVFNVTIEKPRWRKIRKHT
jgi:hypothetical protein